MKKYAKIFIIAFIALIIFTILNVVKQKNIGSSVKIDKSYFILRDNVVAGYNLQSNNLSNIGVFNMDKDSILLKDVISKQKKH